MWTGRGHDKGSSPFIPSSVTLINAMTESKQQRWKSQRVEQKLGLKLLCHYFVVVFFFFYINWQQIVVYDNDNPKGTWFSWWHWSKLHSSRCILSRIDNEMYGEGTIVVLWYCRLSKWEEGKRRPGGATWVKFNKHYKWQNFF